MADIGQVEARIQSRVKQLLVDLGYTYQGDWTENPQSSSVAEGLFRAYHARKGISQLLTERALRVVHEVLLSGGGLYDVNRKFHDMLLIGARVDPEVGEHTQTIPLIDFEHPAENDFAFAEEVTVKTGPNTKRPDIVLYVNGIALAVLELKRSVVDVQEGIRQNLQNQQEEYIPHFFRTIQLVIAGNDSQGLHYGTLLTPAKYFCKWNEFAKTGKEGEALASEIAKDPDLRKIATCRDLLDQQIIGVLSKNRFLEMCSNFVAFDKGIKKIARPHQYFGVKAAQLRLRDREGGIIWHTQGSGKTLTMTWLARWILEQDSDNRVLVITDRKELDEQVNDKFLDTGYQSVRASCGKELFEMLNEYSNRLVCSLIHKFRRGSEDADGPLTDAEVEAYIEDIRRSLPKNFNVKGNIVVFVDECHRTQSPSGKLHPAMKEILGGKAIFIGFTGTPLLRKDKQTTMEVFGTFIHTYKFNEGVADGVIKDLRYSGRYIPQRLENSKQADEWFEMKTNGLTDVAKETLKKRWATLQRIYATKERLERIVWDIVMDMNRYPRLVKGTGNAMLIADSIYSAFRYWRFFQGTELKGRCAVVTSYIPSKEAIRNMATGNPLKVEEEVFKYDTCLEMLKGQTLEAFEKDVKDAFIDKPAQMKLLIVVDKLLTGFDAPPATYLYIDKKMQDHGLFQAICRVNRCDSPDKDFGYIIDYKDAQKDISIAIDRYTSEILGGYDPEDVKGIIRDRTEAAKAEFEQAHSVIDQFCAGIKNKEDDNSYYNYFCGAEASLEELIRLRKDFYANVARLSRAFANLGEDLPIIYNKKELRYYQEQIQHYENARLQVQLRSGDYVDLTNYESDMRVLLDTYVKADAIENVTDLGGLSLLTLVANDPVLARLKLSKALAAGHPTAGPSDMASSPDMCHKDALPLTGQTQAMSEGIDGFSNVLELEQYQSPATTRAVAETMSANIRSLIISAEAMNPEFYRTMAERLAEILRLMREEKANYTDYIEKLVKLVKDLISRNGDYPPAINSNGKKAVYDKLKDEAMTLAFTSYVDEYAEAQWYLPGMSKRKRQLMLGLKPKTDLPEDTINEVLDIMALYEEYQK
jgi:type I restriction enzyme R subunit